MFQSKMTLRQKPKQNAITIMTPRKDKRKRYSINSDPKLMTPVKVVISPTKEVNLESPEPQPKQNSITIMTPQKDKRKSYSINNDPKLISPVKIVISPTKEVNLESPKLKNVSINSSVANTTANILNGTVSSDPKLKLACKVRVLRINFDDNNKSELKTKEYKTPSPKSDPKSSIICKVQLRKMTSSNTKKVKLILKDQNQDGSSSNELNRHENSNENQVNLLNIENTSNETNSDKFNMICKVHLERMDLFHLESDKVKELYRNNSEICDGTHLHNNNKKKTNRKLFDQNSLSEEEILITSLEYEPIVNDVDKGEGVDWIDKVQEAVNKPVDESNLLIGNSKGQLESKKNLIESSKINSKTNNCELQPNLPEGHVRILCEPKGQVINIESGSKDQKCIMGASKKKETKNRARPKKAPLTDCNRIIPKKRERKKKPPLDATIPKNVVEKCTDRIPVYTEDIKPTCGSGENKSDTYDFDSDTEAPLRPAKIKKPRKPRVPKKKKNTNKVYDIRINDIVNKLAETIRSNKIVAKDIPRTKRDVNGKFPVKTVRIQVKQHKLKFTMNKDALNNVNNNEQSNINNKENNIVNNRPKDNSNDNLKSPHVTICDNTEFPKEKPKVSNDTFCGFNNRSVRLSKTRRNIMNGYLKREELAADRLSLNVTPNKTSTPKNIQNPVEQTSLENILLNVPPEHSGQHSSNVIPNLASTPNNIRSSRSKSSLENISKITPIGASTSNNIEKVIPEKETSLQKHPSIDFEDDLHDETITRPKSLCSVYNNNDELSHFGFDDNDSLPSFSDEAAAKCASPWRYSPNSDPSKGNSTIIDNTQAKSNGSSIQRIETDICLVRPESVCSATSRATNLFESIIADDDRYFGFDDENESGANELSSNETSDFYQTKRRLTNPDSSFRKTGSPWRFSPRNVSYNPHFVRLKNNGLPIVNQDPILDYTYDENIKQYYPALNDSERSKTPITKSPLQKSILNYITTNKDITHEKENVPRLSIFDNEDFSPMKISDTPKRPKAKKAKRNILGALNDNIIIHSVQIISTPLIRNGSKNVESPDLSAIFDDIGNGHAIFHNKITHIRTRQRDDEILAIAKDKQEQENMKLQIETTRTFEDKFQGFSCTNIETAKIISNKLNGLQLANPDEENSRQRSKREQTFFGFETVIEDSSDIQINDDEAGTSNAKPSRWLVKKVGKDYQKRGKKLPEKGDSEEAKKDLRGEDRLHEEVLDSDRDFNFPTPVPENEPLKVGLFEDIEVVKPNKTYTSKRRRRRVMSVETEADDEHEKPKKKRKDQPTKHDIEELEKWASEFNKMCEEVEQFPLEIE